MKNKEEMDNKIEVLCPNCGYCYIMPRDTPNLRCARCGSTTLTKSLGKSKPQKTCTCNHPVHPPTGGLYWA